LKEYVLFLVCFDLFIGGPETVYEWDREKEIPAGLRDVMGFLYQRLPALLDLGAEMWPMEQATVYFRWARGLAHPYGDLIVVTYDASEKGIAAVIIMEPERFCAWKECTLKGCPRLSLSKALQRRRFIGRRRARPWSYVYCGGFSTCGTRRS
jgi:hypothetical protein